MVHVWFTEINNKAVVRGTNKIDLNILMPNWFNKFICKAAFSLHLFGVNTHDVFNYLVKSHERLTFKNVLSMTDYADNHIINVSPSIMQFLANFNLW